MVDDLSRSRDIADRAQAHLDLLRMIAPTGWFSSPSDLQRAAAMIVTGLRGETEDTAETVVLTGEAFAGGLPFWSNMRGEIRAPLAAFMVVHGLSAEDAIALRTKARALFKAQPAGYVEPYGFLAAMVLRARHGDEAVTAATIAELSAVTRGLRRQHWFSYYHDVLPLVAAQPRPLGSAGPFTDKCRSVTTALNDAGFHSYAERLRAGLILTAAGGDTRGLIRAMQDWRLALKGQALPDRMLDPVSFAMLVLGWGPPDRAGTEGLGVLHQALRHGRPRADHRVAVNAAAALLARIGLEGRDGPTETRRPLALVMDAQAICAASVDRSGAGDDGDGE